MLRFDTHQAPRAAGQVGEMLVLGGHGSYGTACIVTGNGNDGYCSQSCHLLNFFRQHTDLLSWLHHASKVLTRQSDALQQSLRQFSRSGVKHLRGRGNGIFAHRLTGQHPAQRIGYEEYLLRLFQGRVTVLPHGIQLKQRVEVHQLDAGDVIHLLATDDLLQILLHSPEGMRVTVCHRIAQQRTILRHEDEIDAPRINADRRDGYLSACHLLQTAYHLKIEGIDIPIEMTACLYQIIREARQLLLFQFSVAQHTQDGSSAGSSQIDGKIVFLLVCHDDSSSCCLF